MAPSPLLEGIEITVLTVSDRSFAGERPDATGPLLTQVLRDQGALVTAVTVPDDAATITTAIDDAVTASHSRVVVTTGGTGISPRDVTPEATASLLVRDLPGIPELLRMRDAHRTPLVALSRGLAGVTRHTPPAMVVNLPGSLSAVESALEVLPAVLAHALAQLDGSDH